MAEQIGSQTNKVGKKEKKGREVNQKIWCRLEREIRESMYMYIYLGKYLH